METGGWAGNEAPETKNPMMPKQILALGEVLWDVFPDGPHFGGAPANFACCVAELGQTQASVAMASAVGHDPLGQLACKTLALHGVDHALVVACNSPTGQVDVNLDSSGKPSYHFIEHPAWDTLTWSDRLATASHQADLVCFGTLAQRSQTSRSTIRQAIATTRPNCLRILDINLRAPFWDNAVILESLPLASVLKLNDEELPILAALLNLEGTEEELVQGLLHRFPLRLVALTRGAHGSLLISDTGTRSEVSGLKVNVVDTVGAGDAFTAALGLGLLYDLPLNRLNAWANEVAAYVCTQTGGTPTFPTYLHLSKVLAQ